MTSLTPAQVRNPAVFDGIRIERARAIAGLANRYVSHPWAVDFLLIVSPLVTWIWLGAIVIAIGGLIALWPVPLAGAPPGRVRAARGAGCAGGGRPRGPARPRTQTGVEFVIVC